MSKKIRVGVVGAAGKMGREVCKVVSTAPDMELAIAVDRNEGLSVSEWAPGCEGLVTVAKLGETIEAAHPVDVIVDFTHPKFAASNALVAIRRGAAAVIGTSGLSPQDLAALRSESEETGKAVLYMPNFAIGAVLMMKFAAEAARHFPECEIVEMHHDKKADAPSGTAIRTAEMIAQSRTRKPNKPATGIVKFEGARGGSVADTPVHSVRLPGLVAHQMVLFGGQGEVLTIRHDSLSRESFMPGVLLAIRKAPLMHGLTVGLEHLLD
ncbi:MAG: 4-hydroxy-tetrahydrodipicolinate reductase [Armatimonadetes bacterium]|nr:MAG: 4-hydroxy-tetrahydrodipicolinate reductase [Armatimonadota bacterium]